MLPLQLLTAGFGAGAQPALRAGWTSLYWKQTRKEQLGLLFFRCTEILCNQQIVFLKRNHAMNLAKLDEVFAIL